MVLCVCLEREESRDKSQYKAHWHDYMMGFDIGCRGGKKKLRVSLDSTLQMLDLDKCGRDTRQELVYKVLQYKCLTDT